MGKEIKIGIISFITLAAVIWGYLFVIGKDVFGNSHTYHTYFNNVKDLTAAAPVMVNGLQVGAVTKIDLVPEDVNKIKVEYQVNTKIRIPSNTIAQLKALNPIAGRFIDLNFERMCDGTNCAQNGQELQGSSIGLLGSLVGKDELGEYTDVIGSSLNSTIGKLGDPDSDAPLDASIRNLEIITNNLTKVTSNLNSILYASKENLNQTLANMASISGNLNANNEKITSMISNLNTVSRQFAAMDLNTTMDKTNGAIDQASSALQEMEKTISAAQQSVNSMNDIMAKIDGGDGTLAKLINDKELYLNMETTSKNLSLLLQDMRLNPRRYVNVSVFGKKDQPYTYPEDDPAWKKTARDTQKKEKGN